MIEHILNLYLCESTFEQRELDIERGLVLLRLRVSIGRD